MFKKEKEIKKEVVPASQAAVITKPVVSLESRVVELEAQIVKIKKQFGIA